MKKDPFTIMREIFETLESGKPFSLNQLAEETGLHNVTVRKYVQMIEYVRQEPTVEIIRTRNAVIVRCTQKPVRHQLRREILTTERQEEQHG